MHFAGQQLLGSPCWDVVSDVRTFANIQSPASLLPVATLAGCKARPSTCLWLLVAVGSHRALMWLVRCFTTLQTTPGSPSCTQTSMRRTSGCARWAACMSGCLAGVVGPLEVQHGFVALLGGGVVFKTRSDLLESVGLACTLTIMR
jgi:hypothetical protein